MIWVEETRKDKVRAYLRTGEAKSYRQALESVSEIIDGFESPLGMELLASVDWLLSREGCEPTIHSIRSGLQHWPGGQRAAERKQRLFDDAMIGLALDRLTLLNDAA